MNYILVAGTAGLSGAFEIAKARENELMKRFPSWLLERLKNPYPDEKKENEVKELLKDADFFIECGEGGVMTGLWDLSKALNKGFEIDIMKIPIRQEVVEISEFFHIDPYRLQSFGTFILAGDDPIALMEKAKHAGLDSEIIGKIIDGKDKILYFDTDSELRYLDRPRRDELYKVIREENHADNI